jgi:hypothetical protein
MKFHLNKDYYNKHAIMKLISVNNKVNNQVFTHISPQVTEQLSDPRLFNQTLDRIWFQVDVIIQIKDQVRDNLL